MPAPRSYHAHAIVLRSRHLGEADKIFTLFTEECGKLDAVAKGVRRGKSRFMGKLERGARVFVTLHRGRSLEVISDVELMQARWPIVTEPASYAVAHLMLELVDVSCEAGMAMPEMYALLDGALSALVGIAEPKLLVARFEARLLAVLGVAPYDQACVHCLRSLDGAWAWADLDAGGLACEQCRPYQADAFVLEPREVANFRALGAARNHSGEASSSGRAALTAEPAAARAIDAFLTYHLGKRPKAGRFVEELR